MMFCRGGWVLELEKRDGCGTVDGSEVRRSPVHMENMLVFVELRIHPK